MKSGFKFVGTFLLGLAAAAAHSWGDTGHMLVATIAESHLTPKASAEATRLLAIGSTEKTSTFVTAASWADDVRRDRTETEPWHYINYFFRADGKLSTNQPQPTNVVVAIDEQKKILADASQSDEKRADALRYLIHFVGDIHQPLHATARETDSLPTGDRGGNDFKLADTTLWPDQTRPVRNLHQLWDAGAGAFKPMNRPITPDAAAALSSFARSIEDSLTAEGDLKSSPESWAKESFEIARTFAYTTPENAVPSETYLREGRRVSLQRVGLAGRRLAELLNEVLG
jgi:hypothetical protein